MAEPAPDVQIPADQQAGPSTQDLLDNLSNVEKAVVPSKKRNHPLNSSQTGTNKEVALMRYFLNQNGADENEVFGNPVTTGIKLKDELLSLRATIWFGFKHEMIVNLEICKEIYSALLKDKVKNMFLFQENISANIVMKNTTDPTDSTNTSEYMKE